jgi:hypothetical protein
MSPAPNANSRPEFVNALVQHRVDTYERQQARRLARSARPPSPVAGLCLCLEKPPVAASTAFRRYTCGCQRQWMFRSSEGWFPVS